MAYKCARMHAHNCSHVDSANVCCEIVALIYMYLYEQPLKFNSNINFTPRVH